MPNLPGGYQPDTKSESARRADFDLLRRIAQLERQVEGLQVQVDAANPKNARGIVATGSFVGSSAWSLPVGTTRITNLLPFTSIAGRRYRMVLQIRVVSPTSGNGLNFVPQGDGAYQGVGTDAWVSASPGYSSLHTEVLFNGTGVASSYYWNGIAVVANTLYLDVMSYFYIEDVGSVTP